MKRLGKCSGKIYEETETVKNECTTIITDEQANDKDFIFNHHNKDMKDCISCRGCEIYNIW